VVIAGLKAVVIAGLKAVVIAGLKAVVVENMLIKDFSPYTLHHLLISIYPAL